MKYVLSIFGDESAVADITPEQMKALIEEWADFEKEMVGAGVLIAGEGLQESGTATTIRIADSGERLVVDGPFAETKEQLGGFYLIECESLDDALDWAKKIPAGPGGSIEVRPVMEYYAEFGIDDPRAAAQGAGS
jgi:hypothetical protein